MSNTSLNAKALIDIVRCHGVYGLAGSGACRCAHFSLQNIDIDISCHKSGGLSWHRWGVIRVSTGFDDVNMEDRATIAEELLRLLTDKDWEDEYDNDYWVVRFCDWKYDKEQTCIYCSKPREEQQGYLCNQCLTGSMPYGPEFKIAESYDFRRIEIRRPVRVLES